MRKFRKVYNLKIILLIAIGLISFNNMTHGADKPDRSCLRVPIMHGRQTSNPERSAVLQRLIQTAKLVKKKVTERMDKSKALLTDELDEYGLRYRPLEGDDFYNFTVLDSNGKEIGKIGIVKVKRNLIFRNIFINFSQRKIGGVGTNVFRSVVTRLSRECSTIRVVHIMEPRMPFMIKRLVDEGLLINAIVYDDMAGVERPFDEEYFREKDFEEDIRNGWRMFVGYVRADIVPKEPPVLLKDTIGPNIAAQSL